MKKKPDPESEADAATVRARALALLSRREHSALELKRKLQQRGFADSVVEPVLKALAAENLLSEARFAEAWVRSRIARGQGPRKVEAELRRRALGDAEIASALAASGADWTRLAAEACRKRFGPQLPSTLAEKARQTRFLQARGFDAEQIRHALREED